MGSRKDIGAFGGPSYLVRRFDDMLVSCSDGAEMLKKGM